VLWISHVDEGMPTLHLFCAKRTLQELEPMDFNTSSNLTTK
jgi:hypothetical protein